MLGELSFADQRHWPNESLFHALAKSRRVSKNASNRVDRNVPGSNVRKQSRGMFLGCWACAASGLVTVAPQMSVMNSRRRMCSSSGQGATLPHS
jgi:hypothetical protein